MFIRRTIGLTIVALAAITLVPLAPVLIVLAWIIARTTKWSSLDRALLFGYGFLFLEISGVLALVWVGIRHRGHALMEKSYKVQWWWASCVVGLATRLFNMRFDVTGEEAIEGDGFIIVSRHTNLADNFFPLVFVAVPRQEPVRYILKQELRAIPTLDIGGHRLPCVFVDRSGLQTEVQLERVRDLLTTCEPKESLLIYPEGTRYTPKKQAEIRAKGGMAEQVDRWPDLLPPRLGGITALLEANTSKDVVFLCHTGFEGSGGFADLIDGTLQDSFIRIRFWRVPYDEIGDDHQAFVFNQWDRMQATLLELRATETAD